MDALYAVECDREIQRKASTPLSYVGIVLSIAIVEADKAQALSKYRVSLNIAWTILVGDHVRLSRLVAAHPRMSIRWRSPKEL